MQKPILVSTFYKFKKIAQADLADVKAKLETAAKRLEMRGLLILGTEGFNTTMAGSPQSNKDFLEWITNEFELGKLVVKESWSDSNPFRRYKVKIREEIVTLGKPEVLPLETSDTHLSPEQWHQALQDEGVLVLDTRNWYETKVGKFKQAMDPDIEEFHEFPEYLKNAGIPKDKKVLIYCTGGIRCEKAIVEMHNQGFTNVFQLDGGILNYIEKYPNQEFDGECFVFDHRVALDQNLEPSKKFKMCPHCGQPADNVVTCPRCDSPATVCEDCLNSEHLHTCSKDCAYHYSRNRLIKGPQNQSGYRASLLQEQTQSEA